MDATQEITMASEVAKPFNILSAYFTTTATIKPPPACNTTRYHTKASNPARSLLFDPLLNIYVMAPNGKDSRLNCTFRIQTWKENNYHSCREDFFQKSNLKLLFITHRNVRSFEHLFEIYSGKS